MDVLGEKRLEKIWGDMKHQKYSSAMAIISWDEVC